MADDLLAGLRKQSKNWATAITTEANKNLGKFKKLIKVGSRTVEEGGKLMIVSTGMSLNKKKPVARAYEYGSGKRSRSRKKTPHQNAAGFIEIRPVKKKALAFKWDTGLVVFPKDPPDKYLGISEKTGKKLFLYVEHPGVQAANSGKGYLSPAFAKIRKQIRKDISPEVRKAAIGTFKKAFVNAKG